MAALEGIQTMASLIQVIQNIDSKVTNKKKATAPTVGSCLFYPKRQYKRTRSRVTGRFIKTQHVEDSEDEQEEEEEEEVGKGQEALESEGDRKGGISPLLFKKVMRSITPDYFTKRLPHVTYVTKLNPNDDRYLEVSRHFEANWIKANTTGLRVETILAVESNQEPKFMAYRDQLVREAKIQPEEEGVLLYHGTRSCHAQKVYDQQSVSDLDAKDNLCCLQTCATCGILAYGIDLNRSGQGSTDRGQRHIWQRFGHGFYFSPHPSKCHFYAKTGVTNYHPQTGRRYATILACKVLMGKIHQAKHSTRGGPEESWKCAPADCDSVVGPSGCGDLQYQENVIYRADACLPSEIITYSFETTSEY